uniref:Uncharacterized protein n=1 Tax=Gloeothece verrucosa (strain PCC 7822) TaxID=497965 RepID=E0ULB7_GLOV7|nr:hypothetical protein Cyan7822_5893 [Gloeothece verrucosa PCC 7822]
MIGKMSQYYRQLRAICLPLMFLVITEAGYPMLVEWFDEKDCD